LILNHFSIDHPSLNSFSASKRIKTVSKPRSLHLDRIKTLRLVGLPVDLFESLALHLKLHLRVFLEDLGVALPKHLSHPLVRDAAGAEPRSICRTEIINPKIRNLRTPQGLVPNRLERCLAPPPERIPC